MAVRRWQPVRGVAAWAGRLGAQALAFRSRSKLAVPVPVPVEVPAVGTEVPAAAEAFRLEVTPRP